MTTVKSIRAVESKFRKAASDHPDDVFSLAALAQLLADLGRQEEAARYFEKAIEPRPEKDILMDGSCSEEALALAMGWYAALVEGNGAEGIAKAETLYERALGLNPLDCLCMGNYAMFLHRIKKDYKVRKKVYQPTTYLFNYSYSTRQHLRNDYLDVSFTAYL